MKIFLSWSGERSNKIAKALAEWLPCVIQAAQPWMSAEIAKGARWGPEIAKELQETKFGIVCVTPENWTAPWLLFETGALSKTLAETFVCPYLLGIKSTELEGPLTQFQSANADRTDTLGLIQSINNAQDNAALPLRTIESTFEMWWPKLENRLQEIAQEPSSAPRKRDQGELLEEILDIVRQLNRDRSRDRTGKGSGLMGLAEAMVPFSVEEEDGLLSSPEWKEVVKHAEAYRENMQKLARDVTRLIRK